MSENPAPAPVPVENQDAAPARSWRTVVHNDPVNLMTYVQWVFESYFRMTPPQAYKRMMEVHTTGRSVVSHGQREQMETDARAMHTYGLWATVEEETP